ncbi:hypothetical protein M0R72_18210 [Candidatus Pacearchaeota archaeon]|jgi:hypothetical protein|nr:hypothetical protein [Candidatus Pacearchaeota archaeon]
MFDAGDVMAALNRVLQINNVQVDGLIRTISNSGIQSTELLRQLSMVIARGEALEILTEELGGYQIEGFEYGNNEEKAAEEEEPEYQDEIDWSAAEINFPSTENDVENDEPDREDVDQKKNAEEARGFFG